MARKIRSTRAAQSDRSRAVIYARVSSKEQEKEGFSIPAQLKLLKEYASAQGFEVDREYVDVETAKQSGRTAFGGMVAYLQAHPGVRVMLVEKTDRLYRNLKDWVTVDELGVEIHFAKEGVDLSMHDTVRLTAMSQYNLFPNASALFMPDMISVLSSRPGPTPDECQFVMMTLYRSAPDSPRSQPITAEVPAGTSLGFVMNEDIGIMRTAQLGLHQPSLKHLALSAEECRVINLHRNLDEWVLGTRPA